LVVLSLFSAQVLWQQQRIGMRRVDRELADLTATLTSVLRDEVRESAPAPAQEAIDTVGVRQHAMAILDDAGRPLAATWNGLTLPAPLTQLADADRAWTADTPSGAWRLLALHERIGAKTYIVLAGTPYTNVLREQHESEEAMAIGIPVAVLLAALG